MALRAEWTSNGLGALAIAVFLVASPAGAGHMRPAPRSTGQLDYRLEESRGHVHAAWGVEAGRETIWLTVNTDDHPGTLRIEVWARSRGCLQACAGMCGECVRTLVWRQDWRAVTGIAATLRVPVRATRGDGRLADEGDVLYITLGSDASEDLLIALARHSESARR